jgi:hypothetical protein
MSLPSHCLETIKYIIKFGSETTMRPPADDDVLHRAPLGSAHPAAGVENVVHYFRK